MQSSRRVVMQRLMMASPRIEYGETEMQVQIGKEITLDVDTSKLSAAVMEHVTYIGLRNILMDSHASATVAEHGDEYRAVAQAMAEKKLVAMYAGEVRTTATREGDPVRAEAVRLATDAIRAAIRKAGRKMKSDKHPDGITPAQLREAAIKHLEKTPAILALAKKRVDEARASGDADLAELIG